MIGSRYKGIHKTHTEPTRALKKSVIKEANGICYYCGEPNATTVDHKVPRTWGGKNDRSNLVAACLGCNQGKGDQTASEYNK